MDGHAADTAGDQSCKKDNNKIWHSSSIDNKSLLIYSIPIGGIKVNMPKGIPRDQSVQHTMLHRLKITRGQLDKVISMVEDGHYCIHIIHQSLAIQSALRQIDQIILKNHLQTCVADAIKHGNEKEVIEEVMKVMEKKS